MIGGQIQSLGDMSGPEFLPRLDPLTPWEEEKIKIGNTSRDAAEFANVPNFRVPPYL
jgi:hypothetical protein